MCPIILCAYYDATVCVCEHVCVPRGGRLTDATVCVCEHVCVPRGGRLMPLCVSTCVSLGVVD